MSGRAAGQLTENATLGDFADVIKLVAVACRRDPDSTAIRFEDGAEISRRELRAGIERFGGHLRGRLNVGERVAIALENRVEFMIAWLAVVANGGTLVTVNPASGPEDAGHVLRDSGSVIVIANTKTEQLVKDLRPQLPSLRETIVVGDPEPHGLDEYDGSEPLDLDAVRLDPTIPTNVYYTSGTTGRPKGCQLGHTYWLRFVELWLSLYGMEPDDRLLCCVPFFYGDAPWELLTSLHAGCPWIVMRRFSVSRFWHVVRNNRVTQLFTLASMPALLLKAPSTSEDREHEVRFAVHVGVPANLHAQMHARWGFPWAEGYGLTETGLVIAMPLARAAAMVGSGSIGVPCPGAEVRLLDEQGEELTTGMPGEIAVRAPGMMQAYLNRPHDTAETLRDGWLHTGDLARVDDLGYYHFLGRRKDIVRRSGENVSAGEVEAVLREHPQVRDAAVIAVPDDLHGEEVGAYIEPVDPRSDLRPEELVKLCLARLARHKVPRYVRICSSPLPRTASMRVNKPVLRENDAAAPAARWDREQALGW